MSPTYSDGAKTTFRRNVVWVDKSERSRRPSNTPLAPLKGGMREISSLGFWNLHPRKHVQRAFATLAFCTLLFASCQLAPPQAPSWETEINLPLINKRYAMQEIIADENDFYADQDGLVHFASTVELDSFGVGERMAINALQESFNYQLGRFKIPASSPLNVELSLRQIYPAAGNQAGQTAPIPALGFSLVLLNLQDFDSFFVVDRVTGTITVYLRNGLPVPLGPLHIELRESTADTLIAAFDHNSEIPPNGEMTRVLDLGGRGFSNNITPVISGQSPGSRGNLVFIDPESKARLTLTASAFEVESARARIGTLKFEDAGEIALGDSLQLVSARVKSGALTLNLQGNFPVRTEIAVALPDFRARNNDTLKAAITLQSNGSSVLNLNLAGYDLQPRPAPFGQQKIRFIWKVRTLNSANEFVTLTSAAGVRAACASTRIVFSKIQGAITAKQITLAPQSFELNLPTGLDSLRLLEAQLQIILRNGIDFPVQTDLRVEGFPEKGPKVQLFIRERIAPGQADGTPVESRIVIDGATIQNFLEALPHTLKVTGRVWVGERSYTGSVSENDAVATSLRFDTPLALVLPAQRVESEVSTLTIDEATRERITKHLLRGGITLRLDNRLPFEASAAVHLARKSANVFRAPDLVVGPVKIALPPLDPLTGRALQPRSSEAVLALNETQLKLFQASPLYVGVLLTLPGSNGKVIRIAMEDYVEVQALATMRLQMDEETLK